MENRQNSTNINCKAAHMTIRKAKQGSKKSKRGGNSQVECYYFDVEKCKHCTHLRILHFQKCLSPVPRTLDFENNELVKTAKNMGICFGE